jgi:hypothetical protein
LQEEWQDLKGAKTAKPPKKSGFAVDLLAIREILWIVS